MALEVRGSMDGSEPDSVLEVMRQQWASMLSMGGMFVGTILLGLSIQPVYDFDEVRAFGPRVRPRAATLPWNWYSA